MKRGQEIVKGAAATNFLMNIFLSQTLRLDDSAALVPWFIMQEFKAAA